MFKRNNKLVLTLVLVLALVLGMFSPMGAAAAEPEAVNITIIHTNDVHSRIDSEAYVATLVKQRKEAGENVLVLNAGDVLHGQPFATVSSGSSVVDVMNLVGYDAMAPGNHDFNYGWSHLAQLAQEMDFPVLAANVKHTYGKDTSMKPYIIKEIGGVKVGIFGLATPETVTKTNPKNVAYLEFESPVLAAKRTVAELEENGAELIICLSHLGLDEETIPTERSTAVAGVAGVDIVIDGHSHHALPEGMQVSNHLNNSLIAQTGSYGENIGIVEVTVTGGVISGATASLVKVPEEPAKDFAPDAEVTELIAQINKDIEKVTSKVIGTTGVLLQGERDYARTQETNLGDLICDAMIAETGADLAITNGGGIRASIAAGDITMGDVLTVLPFGNYVVVRNIPGSAIIEALEHGIQSYPATAGGFPQVGGIKFTFDPSKTPGERVTSVTLQNGTELKPNETYKVATNDFMAAGGDGYEMLAVGSEIIYSSLDEVLISYLQTNPAIPEGTQGRIVAEK